MTLTIARWEFRLLTRGPAFWLAALAAAAIALHIGRNEVRSPMIMTYAFVNWAIYIIPLIFLSALGAARRRDEAAGTLDLIHSRPVSTPALVLGKFAGGLAALAVAWAGGLVLLALVLAVQDLPALAAWSAVALLSGALLLPFFAFITALCLAVDALVGRSGVVLGVGMLVVLGSWLHHPGMWLSNLLPAFMPRTISSVFGFAPYTGVLLANRGLTLALTAALLALALWALPRRVPALTVPALRPLVAALLGVALVGSIPAVSALAAAPRPGEWYDRARPWALEQITAALGGDTAVARHWIRHRFTVGAQEVEVWLAEGNDDAAEPLALAAARLAAHLPELQPHAGAPLRVVESGYLQRGVLEPGALLLPPRDVALARAGRAERPLVRAAVEALWAERMALPMERDLFNVSVVLTEGLAYGASLYQQWLLLEQMSTATAAERALWRQQVRLAHTRGVDDESQQLFASGAAGYSLSSYGSAVALALWDLGEEQGQERVLPALEAALASLRLGPGTTPRQLQAYEKRLWTEVYEALGLPTSETAQWPSFFLPPPDREGR
ncbi:MAG: hypothetical protein ACOY94_14825 [Bacillota bacterium]